MAPLRTRFFDDTLLGHLLISLLTTVPSEQFDRYAPKPGQKNDLIITLNGFEIPHDQFDNWLERVVTEFVDKRADTAVADKLKARLSAVLETLDEIRISSRKLAAAIDGVEE